ncbi:hypothetical protein ACFE04_010792 [Oxalis oulophora]
MGNWRYRRPRRYNYRQQDLRPLYHDEPLIPPSGFDDVGVPAWEKKYCAFEGSIPWRQLVETKMLLYSHKNISTWDDSAGEEAFRDAKNRFWYKYNNRPCDIPLPDPDICIGEIDWNPDIDPQLVKDLEQSFFVPTGEEEEKEWGSGHISKKFRNSESEPVELSTHNSDENPWKHDHDNQNVGPLKSLARNSNQWGNNANESGNLDNDNPWDVSASQNNDRADWSSGWNQGIGTAADQATNWDNGNNPWDRPQSNEPAKSNGWGWGQSDSKKLDESANKNGWGDTAAQSCGWNQGRGNSYQATNWNNGSTWWDTRQSNESARDDGWGSRGVNNSRGWNQQSSRNLSNGYNSRGHNNFQDRARGAPQDRGWRNQDTSSQRRDGSYQYAGRRNNSRFQGYEYQTDNHWREANSKKRVNFARE